MIVWALVYFKGILPYILQVTSQGEQMPDRLSIEAASLFGHFLSKWDHELISFYLSWGWEWLNQGRTTDFNMMYYH